MAWRNASDRYHSRDMLPIALLRRRITRTVGPYLKWALLLLVLAVIEVQLHTRSFLITRPKTNLDPPFHVGCQEPVLNTTARANAVIVMLATNEDVESAIGSVLSVQNQFNQHFGYPWVFLNNEPWSEEFVRMVGQAVADGGGASSASFEVIPKDMWDYPDWIDQDRARANMQKMAAEGVLYADREGYHHMCRFNSGCVSCSLARGALLTSQHVLRSSRIEELSMVLAG